MRQKDDFPLSGRIVRQNDKEYDACRTHWNRAIDRHPDLIIYCRNRIDIIRALRFAKANIMPFRIRNGGHHYEGYSTGDGLMVIDVSQMKGISIRGGMLHAECGVNNRQLYDFLATERFPFAGGDCPTVGICGYVLGGGWGLSCRYLGLGCDSLLECEMIDCNGNLLTVNEISHPDLFWACRGGGGGNFGVVVSMTFALPERIAQICYIELHCAHPDVEVQVRFLRIWQSWLEAADKRMSMIAKISRSPKEDFAIAGKAFFYGTPQDAEQILRPFTVIDGLTIRIRQMTFHEAITIIQDNHADFETFQSTGRFVSVALNESEMMQAVCLLQDVPKGSVYTALTLYSLGGNVSEKQPEETAFFYRNAKYIISVQTQWSDAADEKANKEWLCRQFLCLKKLTQGSYVNFPYGNLTNYMKEYYGANADRLAAIKQVYDPDGFFHFPQRIHGEED